MASLPFGPSQEHAVQGSIAHQDSVSLTPLSIFAPTVSFVPWGLLPSVPVLQAAQIQQLARPRVETVPLGNSVTQANLVRHAQMFPLASAEETSHARAPALSVTFVPSIQDLLQSSPVQPAATAVV